MWTEPAYGCEVKDAKVDAEIEAANATDEARALEAKGVIRRHASANDSSHLTGR